MVVVVLVVGGREEVAPEAEGDGERVAGHLVAGEENRLGRDLAEAGILQEDGEDLAAILQTSSSHTTAKLHTKILDFRGFEQSRIWISRGGIPRPTGKFGVNKS